MRAGAATPGYPSPTKRARHSLAKSGDNFGSVNLGSKAFISYLEEEVVEHYWQTYFILCITTCAAFLGSGFYGLWVFPQTGCLI